MNARAAEAAIGARRTNCAERAAIADLRRYAKGDFAHTISDPIKRLYAKEGYLLALEHLETRLLGGG